MKEQAVLLCFVLITLDIVEGDLQNIVSVKVCPSDLKERERASKRLRCGIDKDGDNQYICVPNVEKTSLVEFCYDGIMGINQKGHCLEARDGMLIPRSCKMFLSGCPEAVFKKTEIYKYPACQEINIKDHCYTSDPSCPSINTGTKNDVNTPRFFYYANFMDVVMVLFAIFVIWISCNYLYHARYMHRGSKQEIRLVIVGKSGAGKSATGNSILGSCVFKTTFSAASATQRCTLKFSDRFDKKIVILDTPGLFNIEKSNDKLRNEISKCVLMTYPGPHAFILVMNAATRYTEEDKSTIEYFVRMFGDEIYEYFIVLFTRKDELDRHNMSLQDFINECPNDLQCFIQKCGNRVVAFDNTPKSFGQDKEVKNLLTLISKNMEKNKRKHFTDDANTEAEQTEKEHTRATEEEVVEERNGGNNFVWWMMNFAIQEVKEYVKRKISPPEHEQTQQR